MKTREELLAHLAKIGAEGGKKSKGSRKVRGDAAYYAKLNTLRKSKGGPKKKDAK
jgi:hypothetical protein